MPKLDRAFLEARIEGLLAEAQLLIDRLDEIDGDPDLEDNGDAEADTHWFAVHSLYDSQTRQYLGEWR